MRATSDSIGEELKVFKAKFSDAIKNSTPLLATFMRFMIKRKEKQMRPMFVFLSAKLNEKINESAYTRQPL